ncbi:MAG: hypothetical protein ACRDQ5_21670 [Sciscionella sp.]
MMSMINVRVWVAHQGDVEPTVAAAEVMAEAARIWQAAGVTLQVKSETPIVKLAAVDPAPAPVDLENTVAKELATTLNPVIEGQRDGWLDVVLVPRFGFWGKAYTPLTLVGADKRGTFEPFAGPVLVVATAATRRPGQTEEVRTHTAWPLETPQPPEPQHNPLILRGIANDVAHELGHLFGLWHTTEKDRPGRATAKQVAREFHQLIYATLYNQVAKLRKPDGESRSADEAKKMIDQATGATVAERLHLGQDQEWYVALRGEFVDPEDLKIVTKNINTHQVESPSTS